MGELGDRLRRTRESRGLTIEDAERDTRISRRYLQALEDEKFEVIPAPVYARGFLRSYSQYLGLEPQEMLDLFPRDDASEPATSKQPPKPSRETPLPPQSRSRPAWNRSRTTPRAGRRASPSRFPGSPGEPPAVIPGPGGEPTIGVDIGLPAPARRLDTSSAAATRTALVLVIAAFVIAAIIGLAWLIARAGDEAPAPTLTPGAPAETSPTQEESESPTPEVQRGVVPDVIGLPAERATELITAAGYEAVATTENSSSVPQGNVMDQSPAAGSRLSEGQEVWILVSDGP